jgi:hypothetical protein
MKQKRAKITDDNKTSEQIHKYPDQVLEENVELAKRNISSSLSSKHGLAAATQHEHQPQNVF